MRYRVIRNAEIILAGVLMLFAIGLAYCTITKKTDTEIKVLKTK